LWFASQASNGRTAPEKKRPYTENVSLHGARVISQRPWQPGEEAQVTPLKYGTPVRGRVVYCKRHEMDRYFVGLNSPHPVYLVQLYLPRRLVTLGIIQPLAANSPKGLPVAPCIIVSGQTPPFEILNIAVP